MRRITWLASYPKSGNTWLRVFFTNLRRNATAPVGINELDAADMPHAASRRTFDAVVGYESGDLTHDEVDSLRPEVYLHYAVRAEEPFFCKVHDAYTYLLDGRPLFPPRATAGVLYAIRNPLDVCASFAHHLRVPDLDEIIAMMADPCCATADRNDVPEKQLRQRYLAWSANVLSWVDAPGLRIHVVRYEDMQARPVETFTAAAAFVGMAEDREKVTRALQFSSFDELRRQEQESGFQESNHERPFFRKGKAGGWREELNASQVARIIGDHREVMLRFGYLNEAGEPVV